MLHAVPYLYPAFIFRFSTVQRQGLSGKELTNTERLDARNGRKKIFFVCCMACSAGDCCGNLKYGLKEYFTQQRRAPAANGIE
jgi:hypothetical protein